MVKSLVEKSDAEDAQSERIFWTPSCIDSIFLWPLEDDVKAAGNAELGESADDEAVIGVGIEDD